jgi:hypothetical protein
LWAKQSITGFTNGGASCTPYSVITDAASNVYFTGYFADSVSFGSNVLYSPTASAFLTKYDSTGKALWAEQSSAGFIGNSLAADAFNHIYLAGGTNYAMQDTLRFGTFSLYPSPSTDYNSFIVRFDTAGKAICGSMLNTIGSDVNSLACDSSGTYFYLCGTVDNTLICGPDTLLDIPNTSYNAYLARWQNCDPAGINPVANSYPSIDVFPNPNNGAFTLQVVSSQWSVAGKMQVEIYNVLGESVYIATLKQVQGDNSINIGNRPNGIYFYRVLAEGGSLIGQGKLVISK